MKANELRIGNYLYNRDGIIFQATTISKYNDLGLDQRFCKPIPLTEEWLLKFGFEPLTKKSRGYKEDTYSYSGKVSLILNHDGVRTWTNFWQGNEMRYVHQLQNLYFSLTGEELTIK